MWDLWDLNNTLLGQHADKGLGRDNGTTSCSSNRHHVVGGCSVDLRMLTPRPRDVIIPFPLASLNAHLAPRERPQIIIQVTKHMHVPIYLAGKSNSHKRERVQTQTRRPWRHMQGAAKWCNYKCLNILCVDWSIADLVMVDWRSNPFPVYGIFTHSQQSRKNHMVKCCLIYDKCINAKRLFFFFSERML